MYQIDFAKLSETANRYGFDRLPQGYVVKFDVIRGIGGTSEILLEDSNNDYGRKYPYTIRFAVHTNNKGMTTVRPITNKALERDYGRIGVELVVDRFYHKFWQQMR